MRIPSTSRELVLLFSSSFAYASMAQAQNRIVFDWQGGSGGTLATYPVNLNSTKQITFTVDNVNNLLYSYGNHGELRAKCG